MRVLILILIVITFTSCKTVSLDQSKRHEANIEMYQSKVDHYRTKMELYKEQLKDCKNNPNLNLK